MPSATARWKAPTPTCGWTPSTSRSATAASVRSKALVIAYAVHETGRREVIGIDIGEVESEAFWVAFLRDLVARGLAGVRLAISDEHQGLKAAIATVSSPAPGSAAPCTSCATCTATAAATSAAWSPPPCARSSTPPMPRSLASASGRCWSGSAERSPRSQSCSRTPRRTCLPSTASRSALAEAALHQPAGAGQPRGRPQIRRRRHLPQRRLGDPPRRRPADRAERRVAGRSPLPVGGVDRPGPRGPGR